jgi:hypothetical protein
MEEWRYSSTISSSVLDEGKCLGPRTGIDAMQKKRKTFPLPGTESQPVQPITRRYTD